MPFKDIEQARQYRRHYYKQRRSNGICTACGNPTKIEEAKCQACKDSNRNYVSEIAQRRRSTGLCLNCGKPTREGKTQCQACADYQTLRISERRTTYKKRAVEYLGGQWVDCGLLGQI